MTVLTLAIVRMKIAALRGAGLKWREIGKDYYPRVPLGTLSRILHDPTYDPHKAAIRAALGLPVTVAVAVCPLHGIVHEKRCPGDTQKPRRPSLRTRRRALWLSESWRKIYSQQRLSR